MHYSAFATCDNVTYDRLCWRVKLADARQHSSCVWTYGEVDGLRIGAWDGERRFPWEKARDVWRWRCEEFFLCLWGQFLFRPATIPLVLFFSILSPLVDVYVERHLCSFTMSSFLHVRGVCRICGVVSQRSKPPTAFPYTLPSREIP